MMRSWLKIPAAILVNISLLANAGFAQLAEITFDTPDYPPLSPITAQSGGGWVDLEGKASVSAAGQGFGGTGNALKIQKDPNEEAWISKPVTWSASEPIAFVDFRIRPAANPEGSLSDFFANGSQVAFQVSSTSSQGEVWVLHGNDGATGPVPPPETWYRTNGTFTVPPASEVSSEWIRVTLRQDYGRGLWDLFVNGKFVAADLRFDGRGDNLKSLDFFGSMTGDILVDNISAKTANMLFADADKDGLPDDWELANGSNPNVYDRNQIDPVTGKSFLNKYLDSLWSAGGKVNGQAGIGFIGGVPPLSILGNHRPVGSLKGSLSVGGDGSALYSLPIDIPVGVGGMEPKLSLEYSSNGMNGVAGLGWSLSGLQQIIRGGSSLRKDGAAVGVDGVDFDAKDRFFLDGQRLVCIEGSYGVAPSEYRTEIDSNARIIAQGSGSITHWTVETASGLKCTLGATEPSKVIEAPGVNSRGCLSWSVNEVRDTVGNCYTVHYATDAPDSDFPDELHNRRVAEIRYAYPSLGTGGEALCKVVFDYETRPDKRTFYTVGLRQSFDSRLKTIRVTTGTYENHRYELKYWNSEQTGRSLLQSVQKIGEGGAIPPTTFQWKTNRHTDEKWAPVGNVDIVEYGTDKDSRDGVSGLMSPMAGDPTQIHLTGATWRAIPLPDYVKQHGITSATRLKFDYRAGPLPTFSMIGIDEDAVMNNPARLIKLVGGSSPPGGVVANDLYSNNPVGQFQTKTISFGPSLYTIVPPTATPKYLILVNEDVEIPNGIGESWFKNIKIYYESGAGPRENQVAPIEVALDNQIPQMVTNQGDDLGVRIHDFTGDGRADLIYRRFWNKYGTGVQYNGAEMVNLDAFGQTLVRTLDGYQTFPISPFTNLISGIKGNATDAPWANRADISSIPVDIDADGKMDYCYARNVYNPPGSSVLGHGHGFLTWTPAGWIDRPELALPFNSQNNVNQHRWNHFEFVDLDGDGFQDLVTHLNSGSLLNSTTNQVVSTTGSAWMNRTSTGQGWQQNDTFKLPKPIKVVGVANGELGRRLIDVNGDGLPDFIQSRSVEAKELWLNNGAGFDEKLGTDPDLARYRLPIFLTNGDGDDVGSRLVDLNGDGLVDAIKDMHAAGTNYPTSVYLNTGYGWQSVADGGTGPVVNDKWMLPDLNFTTFDKYGDNHPGFSSMVDINADGLVDLVVGRYDVNTAYINTGSTWWKANSGSFWAPNPGESPTVDPVDYELPEEIYRTPVAASTGKAVGTFSDVNGDGVVDFISDMDKPLPRIWINLRGPEVINAISDGFSRRLEIDYSRLNDPEPLANTNTPAYLGAGTDLLNGHVSTLAGSLIVTRLREPDGRGGWRGTRRHYGDFRYDRVNEAGLGFGTVQIHEEQFPADGPYRTRGYTETKTMRQFPFTGSAREVCSYVKIDEDDLTNGAAAHYAGLTAGYKLVSKETSKYGQLAYLEGAGGLCLRPVQTEVLVEKFDLFTKPLSKASTIQTFDGPVLAPFQWVWNGTKRVPDNPASDPFHGKTLAQRNIEARAVFGFVTQSVIEALDGSKMTTSNGYDHFTSGLWRLGRLHTANVTKTAPNKTPVTKRTAYTYQATGLLREEIVEPVDPLIPDSVKYQVRTEHFPDTWGNVRRTETSAWGGPMRWKETSFGGDGRLPRSETTALGTVQHQYDDQRGLLLSTTDIDGHVTDYAYDTFGTSIATNRADGTSSAEITFYASNNSVPEGIRTVLAANRLSIQWAKSAQASGKPSATVYYDALGRELVTQSKLMTSFSGSSSQFKNQYTVTIYDIRGRTSMVSHPFLAGESIYWTEYKYDATDRIYRTIYPDGSDEGLTTLETLFSTTNSPQVHSVIYNRRDRNLHRYEDQHGRLVSSSDASGQTTSFVHDVEGRLGSVSIGTQLQLTNSYDILGRKTAVWDISGGTTSTAFNGFGEAISLTNGGGVTTTEYDGLGRIEYVTKPGGEGRFRHYYLPVTGANKGKPWKIVAVDASGNGLSGTSAHEEVVSYDSLGRVTGTSKTQFGETKQTALSYNALGLVSSETDAGGLVVVHDYDTAYGSFRVRSRLSTPQTTIWQFGSVQRSGDRLISTEWHAHGVVSTVETDARNGRILRIFSTGLGRNSSYPLQDIEYAWDQNGNLTKRHDKVANKLEEFGYDDLDRLDYSLIGAANTDYDYDNRGNLTLKGSEGRTYGNPSSPFRVTSATVKGTSRAYDYDSSGRVIADGKRTYTWTSDGQLKTVGHPAGLALKTLPETFLYPSQQGGLVSAIPGIPVADLCSTSSATAAFDFDAGGERTRQILERSFGSSAARCITGYFGSYEREIHQTKGSNDINFSTVRELHRHKLGSAVYTRSDPAEAGLPDSIRLSVILTDHIGSTDVVVKADWDFAQGSWKTAASQPVAERQSFDAWGDRRNGNDWSQLRATDSAPRHASALDLDRGFTGHEMLDDFGLVHMNGRIYDPELGRFLGPDPFVQAAEYSQNFNRYSYVLNNPLSYTDPSGHFIGGLHMAGQYIAMKATDKYLRDHPDLAQAVNIVVTVVLSIFTDPITAGAVGGALNARAAGGDFGDVAKGAAIGALQGAVCAYGLHELGITAKGSVQAAINSPSIQSIASAAGAVGVHVVGHGLVGGAANAAMGGKFADGFLSAATSTLAFDLGIGKMLNLGEDGSFWDSNRQLGDYARLLGRTALAGVIGGTAAAVGGGKFGNGAYSAAFQHLANAEMSLRDLAKESSQLKKKVDTLRDALLAEQKRSPGKMLTVTSDEVMLVLRQFVVTSMMGIPTMKGMQYFDFLQKYADTFFHKDFLTQKFRYINLGNSTLPDSGIYTGSDINHMAVGAAWALKGYRITFITAPASGWLNNGISAAKVLYHAKPDNSWVPEFIRQTNQIANTTPWISSGHWYAWHQLER